MVQLVVINSFGPMGSTLLAGLIEKFGYDNVPVRKLQLHHYLMGEIDLNSGVMQERIHDIIYNHSKPSPLGGVSVLDRKKQTPKSLTDYTRAQEELDTLKNAKFETVQDLYLACRRTYNKSVIYKDVKTDDNKYIELTVDIHRFDPEELFRNYQDSFDKVRMIHLHRDFKGWINSLSSQAFVHPEFKNRIKFFPHMRYADYDLYERSVNAMPGLHLQFDDMFDMPIEALAQKIADFIGEPLPDIDLHAEAFDMYGKLVPYDRAFTRFDDNVVFLRPPTISYFEKLIQSNGMKKRPLQFIAWLRYLSDMIRYNLKNSAA